MQQFVKNIVEMRGIVKEFPGVKALDNVDFELQPGEVHMLLGENGAGKSTLVKILSGVYTPDAGSIFVDNEEIRDITPKRMIEKGIRSIYQETNLVKTIDIARNIFLGIEPVRLSCLGIIDKKSLYQQAGELLLRFNINIDPHEIVRHLSIANQKIVEILRALVAEVKAIVLDEPTDVLEDKSRQELFNIVRQLKKEHNTGFIYISHRYAEVYELGDRVTILRDGRKIETHAVADISMNEMIEKMIGGKLEQKYPELSVYSDREAIRIEHLSCGIDRGRMLCDINLSVKQGEIVGITGLMGSGKTELARAIAGIDKTSAGEIFVHGKKVRCSSAARAILNGIAYLTEDRKSEGIILAHTIRDNYALPSIKRFSPAGLLHHNAMNRESEDFREKMKMKAASIFIRAGQLSGGNQQKLVLAKWLGARSKILLIDEPTRGIDILGRMEVYRILKELIADGVAILMFTSDFNEALKMSHRVIVLRRGSICREFKRGEATEEDILKTAIGSISC